MEDSHPWLSKPRQAGMPVVQDGAVLWGRDSLRPANSRLEGVINHAPTNRNAVPDSLAKVNR